MTTTLFFIISYLRHDAVCGGDDEPVGNQGSSAEEQPVQGHCGVPRVFADVRLCAPDDPPVVAVASPVIHVVGVRKFPPDDMPAAVIAER